MFAAATVGFSGRSPPPPRRLLRPAAGPADPDPGRHERAEGAARRRPSCRHVELGRALGDRVQEAVRETLRQHCEEIGRPFEEIELTANLTISFPEDPTRFESTYTHNAYPGQVFGVTGPGPAEAIAQIEELVDVGVSHFQLLFEDG